MLKVKKIFQEKYVVTSLLVLFILMHLFLISKTFTFDKEGNIRASFAGYGDIPFHMTQVSKFGYGDVFNFNEPLFDGDRIRYAFGINYLSGIIFKATDSWPVAFHLPTTALMAASIVLAYLTYKSVLGRRWLALLAIILFLLGGGFGAQRYISDQFIGESMSIGEFVDYLIDHSVSTITRWDAEYPEQNIGWGSPMTLVFAHQRAFFLGIFIFTLSIYLLNRFRRLENKKAIIALAVLYGIAPLGHYHTFLALSIVYGLYLVGVLIDRDRVLLKKLLTLLVVALVIALPQIMYLLGGDDTLSISGNNSFIHFRLGWMSEPTIGSIKFPEDGSIPGIFLAFLKFLWINFGLVLPLAIAALVFLYRRAPHLYVFALLSILFFLVVQIVRVQPWDYDNNKLLVYFQYFAAPAVIGLLYLIKEKQKTFGALIFFAAYILMINSGVVDVVPRLVIPEDRIPVIFNRDAQRMAHYIRSYADPNDTILTTTTHLNLVDSLAGRPVLVGYPGWLWTKGINYGPRENDLRRFFSDPATALDVPTRYSAKYVLIDPTAIYDWKIERSDFESFDKLFESGDYALYKVR